MKRPLLTTEDRNRLRAMADKVERPWVTESSNRAYARGVSDVLHWLADNSDPSPLLEEITR